MIIEQIKKLLGHRYEALNRLEISRTSLRKNYRYLTSLNHKIKVAPVLKSNGYGHGLVEVAKILDPLNPPFFCVDSIYEAYKLLKAGVKSKILIMGYINPKNLAVKPLPFSYVAYDQEQLKEIMRYQPEAGVHIFVDTGMHREGIVLSNFPDFIKSIPKEGLKNIEGIMSHFASADQPERIETKQQVKDFKKAILILEKNNIFPKWRHIANSSGLLNNRALGLEKVSNLARCGIALYGIDPAGEDEQLKPTIKFITHIAQLKKLEKDDKVGYDLTYTAKWPSLMAVLPLGYNDGVDRKLSNKGRVCVNKTVCPIIGRVSMNITTIDVTRVKNVRVGTEAEIDFLMPIPDKIPYESLVHLNPEIKRVVV